MIKSYDLKLDKFNTLLEECACTELEMYKMENFLE
jgi:hypothetical protein